MGNETDNDNNTNSNDVTATTTNATTSNNINADVYDNVRVSKGSLILTPIRKLWDAFMFFFFC